MSTYNGFVQTDTTVTYRSELDAQHTAEADAAFKQWEDATGLDFVPVSRISDADITLTWEVIDGAHSGAAVTTFIEDEAIISFDISQDWSWSEFELVAVHEIGHAVGLGHPDYDDSVMADNGQGSDHITELDVEAIQALYGVASDTALAFYGDGIDFGGWEYGWHRAGWWGWGWHTEAGWDFGWYENGSGWAWGSYWHLGWEWGWYEYGVAWEYGWWYDYGGSSYGWGWNISW